MNTSLLTPLSDAHHAEEGEMAVSAVADRTADTIIRLVDLTDSGEWGSLEWTSPRPSAAFSRRDVHLPGFASAVSAVRARGFEPFIRPVGGRLAVYHEGALVLDLVGRSSDPRPGTTTRFQLASEAIARGLRRLGVDARVGEIPGEYCPGRWSINGHGRSKLVGTGQRLTRSAYLFTAVIVVGDAEPLREAMADAYRCLELPLDPRTVGSVSEYVPGVRLDEVVDAVGGALAEIVPLDGPDLMSCRRLLDPWDPR